MRIFGVTVTNKSLDDQIDGWDDSTCLVNFTKFLDRIQISPAFIENDVGFYTGQVLHFVCGDKGVTTPILEFDIPLEPIVWPEETKH